MIVTSAMLTRNTHELESRFYSQYEWCLNPYLTLRDLFKRLGEECDRYFSLQEEWQKEESIINLYLFVCAIGCIVDDFLTMRKWKLHKLKDRFPRVKLVFSCIEYILNMRVRLVNSFFRGRLVRWKRKWDNCIEQVCTLLIENSPPRPERITDIKNKMAPLVQTKLSEALLQRRMKIHEGYRCQDLTHFDVFSLVQKFIASSNNQYSPVMIVGIRTAGAYFAPLAKVYLSSLGWPNVSWMTIRPKEGLARWEKKALWRMLFRPSPVLVIDDYQNTGQTFLQASKLLSSRRISPRRVTFLAPNHSYDTGWVNIVRKLTGSKVIALEHNELYKRKLMDAAPVENLVLQYFSAEQWTNVTIEESKDIEAINARLEAHYTEGFQGRLKHLYELHMRNSKGNTEIRRMIAKSVGWGWLGYHAFIMAKRLQEFVPPCVGFRNGFLFMEWIGGLPTKPKNSGEENLQNRNISVQTLASYLAARTNRLRLKEDPRRGNSWGWLEMLSIVRSAYGNYLGRLVDRKLLTKLQHNIHYIPAVIDGKMIPREWIENEHGFFKIDFEHHNFGAPELDIVDPAYDVAGAIFEFHMTEHTEAEFLQVYKNLTGDNEVYDRLLLYKLLYGIRVMKKSAECALLLHSEAGNKRSVQARTFLAETMCRFVSGLHQRAYDNEWTKKLFFLDLDGVYDTEVLGFPHTTISGIEAVGRLRTNGWAIVLNTGRSIQNVKSYCSTYAFQGGVGEYGSVFYDNVLKREIPLIDDGGKEQLKRCREVIRTLSNVFVDPEYTYSVRVYRYTESGTFGLGAEEAKNFLMKHNLHKLTCITRKQDTYIIQKECTKKKGVQFVKEYLHDDNTTESAQFSVAAIGDSDEDIGMLEEAEFSYVPRNCSATLRRKAASAGWKILPRRGAQGLLVAAKECTERTGSIGKTEFLRIPANTQPIAQLMFRSLHVAEQSKLKKLFLMTR